MTIDIASARTFLRSRARIIEQRLADFHLGRDQTAAVAALRGIEAYRNDDGGFGHGLEPDVLAPQSQPLGADVAFDILADLVASGVDPGVRSAIVDAVGATMSYLQQAGETGGLSLVFPTVADHPRADHWGDGVYPRALNPTAKIVGNARALGVEHPWLLQAAEFCRSEIERPDAITDAHAALCVLRFLETEPEDNSSWANRTYLELGSRLSELWLFQPMPDSGYGLTPLDFAPAPTGPRRAFFTDESIEAHLDSLAAEQQPDGGWPISWEPPGPASESAWRGVRTLSALRTLHAYGRISIST